MVRNGKPHRKEELISLLGLGAADTLMRTLGGLEFHIEKSGNCRCPNNVSRAIGERLCKVLYKHYAGVRLYIPKGEHVDRKQGDRRIHCLRLLRQNTSPVVIAKNLNYSYRAVIRNKHSV